MSSLDDCDELLDNIKLSLLYCQSNRQTFSFSKQNNDRPFVFPSKCTNIIHFQKIIPTNTSIHFQNPYLDTMIPYSIYYDLSKYSITISQEN